MSFCLSKAIRNAAFFILAAIMLTSGCSPKAYSISGTITGDIVEGVPVYVGGTSTFFTTDAFGKYTIPALVGTKKIIPQKEGYEFTPTERTVNAPSLTVDFVSSEVEEVPYTVSGTITGVGISGVTINVLGKAISTTSDSSGHYSISGLTGSNTLIPSKSGFAYDPTQRIVVMAGTNEDFFGSVASGASEITMMSAGDGHTLAVRGDGTVLATGYNSFGQLGNNSDEDVNVPVALADIGNVTDIACGKSNSAAVVDGHLYTWGRNESGQLGIGVTGGESWLPVEVPGVPDAAFPDTDAIFTDVACGSNHTIALTDDGRVFTFGANDYGQLGRTVDETHAANLPGWVNLSTFDTSKVVGVYAGDSNSFVLLDTGGVVGWGTNYYGELGLGPSQPNIIYTPRQAIVYNVVEVSTGYFHTIVRNSSNELYIWGYGWNGAIGDGTSNSCLTPKKIPGFDDARDFLAAGDSSFVVASNGDVYAWGENSSSNLGTGLSATKLFEPTKVLNLAGIERIFGGYDYTFAFETDGTMWGWGENGDGQLGDATWTSRPLPIQLSW